MRVAERLLAALTPPYKIQGTEVFSSASVGIVSSDVVHSSAEEIVANADAAMYAAKQAGRDRALAAREPADEAQPA